jgi:integrase
MATIKWRLSSRTNADGKSELYLRLTWSKDGRARASSGIYITATKWSAEREQPKKGIDVECKQVTATMSELEAHVLSALVDADPQELDSQWLKKQIARYHHPTIYVGKESTNLVEWMDYYLTIAPNKQQANGRKLTARTLFYYRDTRNKVVAYLRSIGRKDIPLAQVNGEFYTSFVAYLQSFNFTNNTIGGVVKYLKVFLNALDNERKQLVDIGKLRVMKEEVDNIYLNEEELQLIHDAELPRHLDRVRDCFLLLAWTGCRYSDLQQIDKSNIKGEVLSFRQHKTNNRVAIPIHPVVREIFEKYNYELPNEISNQKFNDYLKDVARLSGITATETKTRTEGGRLTTTRSEKWQLVTSHTGRRSFATNMYKRGLPSIMIMSITGHKTESAFLKYIKVRQEEHAEMMADIWRKIYE